MTFSLRRLSSPRETPAEAGELTKGEIGLNPVLDPGLPPDPLQDPGLLHLVRGSMVPGSLSPRTSSGRRSGRREMDPPPRNQSLINPNCVQTLPCVWQFNFILRVSFISMNTLYKMVIGGSSSLYSKTLQYLQTHLGFYNYLILDLEPVPVQTVLYWIWIGWVQRTALLNAWNLPAVLEQHFGGNLNYLLFVDWFLRFPNASISLE